MTTSADDSPEHVTLTLTEANALKDRIKTSPLSSKDIKLMIGLINFNLWLQQRLTRAKLSIKRLKNLFGITTKKKTVKKSPPIR